MLGLSIVVTATSFVSVKAPAMNGQVKDVGIVVSCVLDPIPMVYVPIQHKDSFGLSRVNGMLCCNGTVVEVTKA